MLSSKFNCCLIARQLSSARNPIRSSRNASPCPINPDCQFGKVCCNEVSVVKITDLDEALHPPRPAKHVTTSLRRSGWSSTNLNGYHTSTFPEQKRSISTCAGCPAFCGIRDPVSRSRPASTPPGVPHHKSIVSPSTLPRAGHHAPTSTSAASVVPSIENCHLACTFQQEAQPPPYFPEVKPAPVSFYRRPLPSPLVAFSSPEGRKLFAETLQDGGLEGYYALAENYNTQSEPAFCGLGTLVMVLNALELDPKRVWKGPWRWFSEELFDCCKPLPVVKKVGINLDEFACLARCNGAAVHTVPAKASSLEQFREHIKQATSRDNLHLVVSFSRAGLHQTGDGHYSPIGAYHPGKDLVLVFDVARFKYPSYWCPVSLLWEAMQPVDKATGESRGYFLMSSDAEVITTALSHADALVNPVLRAGSLPLTAELRGENVSAPPQTQHCTVLCRASNAIACKPAAVEGPPGTITDPSWDACRKSWRELARQFFESFPNGLQTPPPTTTGSPVASPTASSQGNSSCCRNLSSVETVVASMFHSLREDLAASIAKHAAIFAQQDRPRSPTLCFTTTTTTTAAASQSRATSSMATSSAAIGCGTSTNGSAASSLGGCSTSAIRACSSTTAATAQPASPPPSGPGSGSERPPPHRTCNVSDDVDWAAVKRLMKDVAKTELFRRVSSLMASWAGQAPGHDAVRPPGTASAESESESGSSEGGARVRSESELESSEVGRPEYPFVVRPTVPWFALPHAPHLATMLLLAAPAKVFGDLPEQLLVELSELRKLEALSPLLRVEVVHTRDQMRLLSDMCCRADDNANPPC